MKNLLLIIVILIPGFLFSETRIQFDQRLEGVVNRNISNDLPSGIRVELSGLYEANDGMFYAFLSADNKTMQIPLERIDRITFKPKGLQDFWIIQALKNDVYINILKNGFQYSLRREIDDDVIDYMNYLESKDLFFYDSFLESYLYSLIYRIYPDRINDGRLNALNIRVLIDIEPNAFIFANGTLVISTGLLSAINSEEELIGVLGHEIAHYVLDHSIININAATRRQQRAEFWAAFATAAAAATDIYIWQAGINIIHLVF